MSEYSTGERHFLTGSKIAAAAVATLFLSGCGGDRDHNNPDAAVITLSTDGFHEVPNVPEDSVPTVETPTFNGLEIPQANSTAQCSEYLHLNDVDVLDIIVENDFSEPLEEGSRFYGSEDRRGMWFKVDTQAMETIADLVEKRATDESTDLRGMGISFSQTIIEDTPSGDVKFDNLIMVGFDDNAEIEMVYADKFALESVNEEPVVSGFFRRIVPEDGTDPWWIATADPFSDSMTSEDHLGHLTAANAVLQVALDGAVDNRGAIRGTDNPLYLCV